MINQVQINPKGSRPQIEVLGHSARKSLTVTKTTRHSEANLRWGIKVCSLRRRRTGRLDELVQVDAIGDPSGCSNKSLHKRSEVMPLGVGDLDCCQLILSHLLEVDTNQRQSHISTTPGRRFLPLLHSTRDLVKSSHQRLEIILERGPWPKCRVDP